MTDPTAPTTASYVDTYSPPSSTTPSPAPTPAITPTQATPPNQSAAPDPVAPPIPAVPVSSPAPQPLPPAVSDQPTDSNSVPAATGQSPVSQALEDQNIFFLLGVQEAIDSEKESFLDELQQVIWEDFLENDVELLVTQEEMVEVKALMTKEGGNELEKQEAIVTYLEKLIPDLEEIMLEKALELKADMVKERISAMKEFYSDKPDVLTKVSQAETLVAEDKWREAAELMNTVH